MSSRPEQIMELVERYFPGARPAEKKVVTGRKGTIVIRLRIHATSNTVIEVREVWRASNLVGYGYQLLIDNQPVLRYDNAPHHPEVETYPHHKHLAGRVEPLESPSLESFLEEARTLVKRSRHGAR